MRITRAAARAPALLTVRTTVEPNDDNRAVAVVVESPDFYTSSWSQIDGARAPRATAFTFRDLPDGMYEVTATLIGTRGARAATSAWFQAGVAGDR
jgi:hypothetical protein